MSPFLPALLAMALLPQPRPLQDTDADAQARLKAALDATTFKYNTSSSGKSYTIAFDIQGGRSQTVFITIPPGRTNELVTHRIYTTVWVNTTTAPDDTLLRKIMGKTKKLGAFYIFQDSKGAWGIRFGVNFDATDLKAAATATDTPIKNFKDVIYLVQSVGDEVDKELNGDKDIR